VPVARVTQAPLHLRLQTLVPTPLQKVAFPLDYSTTLSVIREAITAASPAPVVVSEGANTMDNARWAGGGDVRGGAMNGALIGAGEASRGGQHHGQCQVGLAGEKRHGAVVKFQGMGW
jgi:hypothetical protein